jgi:hypothetical protein
VLVSGPLYSRPPTPDEYSTFIPEVDTLLDDIEVRSERRQPPAYEHLDIASPDAEAVVDDIRTEFHPNSGRPTQTAHFADYGHRQESARHTFRPPKKPWRPFRTRLDFEVAELILETAMNAKQTTTLISLLQRCAMGIEKFTIHSHDDLQQTWEQSSVKSVQVCKIFLWVVYIQ